MSLVGLSLSLCVSDIVSGRVRLEDVDAIVCSTCARTHADWEGVMATYCALYWRGHENDARRVVAVLRDDGCLLQPRLRDPGYFRTVSGGHWKDSAGGVVRIESLTLAHDAFEQA